MSRIPNVTGLALRKKGNKNRKTRTMTMENYREIVLNQDHTFKSSFLS